MDIQRYVPRSGDSPLWRLIVGLMRLLRVRTHDEHQRFLRYLQLKSSQTLPPSEASGTFPYPREGAAYHASTPGKIDDQTYTLGWRWRVVVVSNCDYCMCVLTRRINALCGVCC